MMELRPPDPVQLAPPVAMPSYADMANRGMDAKFQPNFSPRAYNKSFQSVLMGEKRPIVTDMRSSEKFQNAPAAIFYDDKVDALAAPLQRTLVGKFNRMPGFEVQIRSRESGKNLSGYWQPDSQKLEMDKNDPIPPPDKGKSIQIDNTPTLVNEETSAKTQDREIVRDTPLGSLIEKERQKLEMDKGDPIQPPDKGKPIQIDNTPTLMDEGTYEKTQDREIVRETPMGSLIEIITPLNLTISDNLQEPNFSSKIGNDSVVGDSQSIGLCDLNTNAPIPSNCDTIESTKSLNSDGRYLEFEIHPRILTRRNSKGDKQSHSIKKDLGKKNLNVEFNDTAIAKSFFISFVYAKNLRSERKILWDELCEIASILDGPWVVGGDFNAVLNVKESKGGDNPNQGSMEDFGSYLLDFGLLDVGYEGNDFTWTNGKVLRRLDRIVFNLEWSDLFSLTRVKHLNRVGSDHCPLLLQCSQAVQTIHSSFREDLVEAVVDFFNGGVIPKGASSTTIVLIPKVPHPKTWSRHIEDNILLAQELVQSIDEKTKGSNVILKLDMMKAYDRIEWAFIIKIMCKFGFCSKLTDMIENCISNCWFSVLFNGETTSYFHGSRGLRQGDPISPTLFIIVAEYLSRGLYNMFQRYPSLHYLARCPVLVPHLAFADDIIIFSNGGALGFHCIRLPIKYLGMPLYKGPKKSFLWDDLISRIAARMEGWEAKVLSPGGRITILKSILTLMPLYLLHVIVPPKSVVRASMILPFGKDSLRYNPPIGESHLLVSFYWRSNAWYLDQVRSKIPNDIIDSLYLIDVCNTRVDHPLWSLTAHGGFTMYSAWNRDFVPVDTRIQGKGICMVSKCYGFSLPVDGSIRHWLSAWFFSGYYVSAGHIRIILPLFVLWFIWLERNDAKHRNMSFYPDRIRWKCQGKIFLLFQAGLLKRRNWKGDMKMASFFGCHYVLDQVFSPKMVRWIKPNEHCFKFNVDGSFQGNSVVPSGGGILCDWHGNVNFFFFLPLKAKSALHAEILSLYHGLNICKDRGIGRVWIEMDALSVINLVQNRCIGEGNQVADHLAALGSKAANLHIGSSLDDFPSLRGLIRTDKLNLPYFLHAFI
ncbi:hypothetical protein SADUNF_Sadunf02G0208300 [Salix dunnii]|uniref:Reverse transcriptase domain-containing protein n=1 Tax=Salix dunnii TaxID=1413687 RepID=A0A835TKI5_9ROSI|nr:hypothetical protein SADUNF_Sadunf02G0208300 [Salix dunnii]